MARDYCDLKNVLYSIDSSNGFKCIKKILKILYFPIENFRKDKLMMVDEFLLIDSSILNNISYKEKIELNNIISITEIYLLDCNNCRCFVIEIETTCKSRTDTAIEITKILSELLAYYNVLIFKNNKAIAFTGGFIDCKESSLELYISEWFEYNMSIKKYYSLQEIEFNGNYFDYLYSIARPYQRYRESNVYLIYGCGYIKRDFGYIDIEDLYEKNKSYYREKYGYDYYEGFIVWDYEEKENDDIEWALLELELDSTNIDEDNDFDLEEFYNENIDFEDECSYDIYKGADKVDVENPEEILELIRQKRT